MGEISIGASKRTGVNAPQAESRQKTSGYFKGFNISSFMGKARRGFKKTRNFVNDRIAELRNLSPRFRWRERSFTSLVEMSNITANETCSRSDIAKLDSDSTHDKLTLYFKCLSNKFSQLGEAQSSSNVEEHTAELRGFTNQLKAQYEDTEDGWNPSEDRLNTIVGEIDKLRERFPNELSRIPTNSREHKEYKKYKENVSEYLKAVQSLDDFIQNVSGW
ncbi:hypothetical protein FIV00_25680 [Labrenzia sp. THAF82]|uniref:hypothetical protein n=1 Tax=Labrenzia sp. THAF82 TaxID=2587861 RepID=UPI0012680BB2|nr:hypothetical protein [Labrenzia sp. THAF82]QFT33912.1 hypothetical protein FIV00_25680 [Labrenzia sp. THAF82]